MTTRRALLAAALAAPALVPRASLGQALRKVRLGSAFTTTTNAMFLMPDLLRPQGIDAEVISFPSLVQRMQAVATGDVAVGNGGLSATMQVSTSLFYDRAATAMGRLSSQADRLQTDISTNKKLHVASDDSAAYSRRRPTCHVTHARYRR